MSKFNNILSLFHELLLTPALQSCLNIKYDQIRKALKKYLEDSRGLISVHSHVFFNKDKMFN
jgi:hypothetical protein